MNIDGFPFRSLSSVLPLMALFMSSGCHKQVNPLEPSPLEVTAAEPGDAVVAVKHGVRVTAAVDAWPGDRTILDDVTPVRLTVENDSGRPLRMHLSETRLIDQEAHAYAALPLYLIDGEARVVRHVYDAAPNVRHDGYSIASPYGPYYQGWRVSNYYYDYGYYDYPGHYHYWDEIPLPTAAMVNRAIPEGTVEDGGFISGFVFFERVSTKSKRVTLDFDLVDSSQDEQFGQIGLTFDVEP